MGRRVRPLEIGAIATIVLVLGAILWPVGQPDRYSSSTFCLSNLKQQALGNIMYAADFDDRFPNRDYWMDALGPYTKNPQLFHDPEVPKGVYGYAFNAALDHAKSPKQPETVPLVYDSVNPIRNASDLFTSLPAGGRHPKENPSRNNVAYADGHAKALVKR